MSRVEVCNGHRETIKTAGSRVGLGLSWRSSGPRVMAAGALIEDTVGSDVGWVFQGPGSGLCVLNEASQRAKAAPSLASGPHRSC